MVNFLGLVIDSTAESLLNLVQAYYVGFDFDIDVDVNILKLRLKFVCLFLCQCLFLTSSFDIG